MKSIYTCLFLLVGIGVACAQSGIKLSGTVLDPEDNPVIGANVYLRETLQGTITNFNGQYEISGIKPGAYSLVVSMVGYRSDSLKLIAEQEDLTRDLRLAESDVTLQEIAIVADRITERTSVSNVAFTKSELETSQGLTEDPIRTLASLPGIGRAGDLFSPSQIYVRGGAPEENLFLMDNNTIHFPWYFGGQKSIFNTETVETIELLTGGFPATYGNHMSSVLNVSTRDGDFRRYQGNASMGFYNASALIEGPIVNDKASWMVAGRRTYLDLFLNESASFPVPSLGDVTYKLSYQVNPKNNLSLSGLTSEESIDFIAANPEPGFPNKIQTGGNNHFQSLQWKSQLHEKWYHKISLTNAFNHSRAAIGENIYLDIDAWQLGARNDLSYFINHRHKIKTGLEWRYGTFNFSGNFPLDPQETDPNDTTLTLREIDITEKGEAIRSAYVLYDGNPLKKIGLNAGLRFDQNPDPGYVDVSPRLAINYQLSDNQKLRFSTGIYHQFPTEAIEDLRSGRAIHYILGLEHRINHAISGWVEAYWKDYRNLVHYDEQLNYSNAGFGSARGVELFLRKTQGKLTGWVSYALSKSERKAPLMTSVNDFEFDQRHILNIVMIYRIHRDLSKWHIPALVQVNFRYANGTPYTPVVGAFNTGNGWVPEKGPVFSERDPAYQNLTLRIEWRFKAGKSVRGTSFMEAWNVYNYKNLLGRSYQYGTQYPNNVFEQPYYMTPFLMGGGIKFEFGIRS